MENGKSLETIRKIPKGLYYEERKGIQNMSEENQQPPVIPHPALALGYRRRTKPTSMTRRIENAMRIVAAVIVNHGEEYLPVFERLEQELKQHRARQSSLARALSLSRKPVDKIHESR